MNIAYNCDCMEYMRTLPDKAFDLAMVDPPYGIDAGNMSMGTNYGRSKNGYPGESIAVKLKKGRLSAGSGKLKNRALQTMDCSWDKEPPSKEYFSELFRVSRNQVIWGGNYFELPPSRGLFVWNKNQPWDNFAQAEIAWTSGDFPAQVITLSNRGGRNDEQKIHPTQKPIKLYLWAYERLQRWGILHPGDAIIDTHLGSGSSRIAAYEAGFNFVGCELNKDYFDKQEERYYAHIAQGNLFLNNGELLSGQMEGE